MSHLATQQEIKEKEEIRERKRKKKLNSGFFFYNAMPYGHGDDQCDVDVIMAWIDDDGRA